ncbi:hypothetical protein [Pontibacter chitinilyticus]|uniref:hypothetical protein n=1 Tax=Pontibacter chitinilyticus TaxID=2674989 RepID=UPI00321B3E4F
MLKKTILLLLVLTGIIPIACCPENPSGPYLLKLEHIGLAQENFIRPSMGPHDDYLIAPNSTYAEDTLLILMDFNFLLAVHRPAFSLQPTALATSCDFSPHLTQLNDKIKDITITSDHPFNEVAAGQPLNRKVVAFRDRSAPALPLTQVIALINSLSGNEFLNSRLSTFALVEKPTGSYKHIFSITITYESGKQETADSIPITW